MSGWNPSIEEQLRNWKPRQPSDKLKRGIFKAGEQPAGRELNFAWVDLSRWLLPALGCFLLVFASLPGRQGHNALQFAQTNLLAPMSGGGSSRVALNQASEHSDINSIPCQRVEWDFGGATPSPGGNAAYLVSHTNKLIQ